MGWAAPPLDKLRAKIAAKYPGIVWDATRTASVGAVSLEQAAKQRKAARDAQQREYQHGLPV